MSGQLSNGHSPQFRTIQFPRTQIAALMKNLDQPTDPSKVICIREAEIKEPNKSGAGNTLQSKAEATPVLDTDYYILRLPCQERGTNRVRIAEEQPSVRGWFVRVRKMVGRSASHLTSAVRMFL